MNPIGQAEGFAVGNIINRITGNAPFLPSFYNSNYSNPVEGVRHSQAAGILHGDRRAIGSYAGRNAGALIGQAIIPIPGLGAVLGGMLGSRLGGYIGSHIGNNNSSQPTPSVTVGQIVTDPSQMNQALANGYTFGSAGPLGGFSSYGPYATGYQGLPSDSSDNSVFVPDFSNYSDQFTGGPAGISDSAPGGGYAYTGGGYNGGGGWAGGYGGYGNPNGGGYQGLGNMGSLGSPGSLGGSINGANTVFGGTIYVNAPPGGGGNFHNHDQPGDNPTLAD